jgi:hypothetical protein
VIDGEYRSKYVGRMTVLTDIACLQMCHVLANRLDAVMAIDAVAGDIHMLKIRR